MRQGIMLVVLVVLAVSSAAQPPAAQVRVDAVRLETVEQMRRVTGELRALRRSRLATQEEGLVLELAVREGDAVERGQVIARLDGRNLELDLDRLRAELSAIEATMLEREAQRDLAETELARMQRLRKEASASQQELDDAVLEAAVARARVARAQADIAASRSAIAIAEKRHGDMEIRSPFDGRVIALMTEVGQWVDTGEAVMELYETGSIEAWIDVPERYAGRLSAVDTGEAPPVLVNIEALGEARRGEIIQVVPAADPLSRLFPVRIRVPDEAGVLRPGMSVVAEIATGTAIEAVTVHKDAILRDDAGEFVYMTAPNERGPGLIGVPMRIARQFAVGDRVAIRTGGLQPGMSVITEGNERMFPTQAVVIQGNRPEAGEAAGPESGSAEGRG